MNQTDAIDEAVRRIGGLRATARALGTTRQCVQGWIERGQLPPERVLVLHNLSGVSLTELAPVLYPVEILRVAHSRTKEV